MKLILEISDGLTFMRWRTRAGYVENGKFMVTDEPGERTGPYGKTHVSRGDGFSACGKQVPVEVEDVAELGRDACWQCLMRVAI